MANKLPETPSHTTTFASNSSDPFPMLNSAWDIFAGKGIRTVFLTIGNSKSAMADLEISECLGCPINTVPLNPAEAAEWAEVGKILRERKWDASGALPYSVGAETKWILPKNLRVQETLPWWRNGTLDLSGHSLNTQNANTMLSSIAATMKLKENTGRIDILKLDTVASAPGLEKDIIYALLSAGFRPAVILVKWSEMPDVDLSTTTVAGHLQNTGYALFSKINNKFLYYYTDQDMYQTCSWEDTESVNPMVKELTDNMILNFKRSLRAKAQKAEAQKAEEQKPSP